MRPKSSEFVSSEVSPEKFPDDSLFEIVMVGKSNVGKSSFINAYAGKHAMAHTSSEPGKTRTVNFYLFDDRYYLVDMPGYGYTKTAKHQREDFARMIRSYLTSRDQKKDFAVYFLVDSRHEPSELDMQVYDFVCSVAEPVIILTKTDKLKRSQRAAMRSKLCKILGREDGHGVLSFSSSDEELIEQARDFTAQIIDSV